MNECQEFMVRPIDRPFSGGLHEERMQTLVHFNSLKFLDESKSFSLH